MSLKTFPTTLSLLLLLSLAHGQDSSAPAAPPLAPVNQVSRYQLLDSLSYLSTNFAGLTPAMPLLRAGEFQQQDDSTIVTQVPEAQGKQSVWVQLSNYWIEPITPPPGRGDALVVPVNDMRVAEAMGEVTLSVSTKPSAKAKPVEVNQDMEVPDQAILSTGDIGTVAVMVGGHTSVRLVPNSRVQFHYDLSGDTPRLEIKILRGATFCKVGRLASGRAPDVAVHGQVGSLATIGSCDFFVQSDLVSLHVCLVVGRLLIGDAIPCAVGNMDWYPADVEADNLTGPQIRHWPHPPAGDNQMDARLLAFAMRQAEDLNVKIKAMLASTAVPLSDEERAYLAHIPRITWYQQASAFVESAAVQKAPADASANQAEPVQTAALQKTATAEEPATLP